MDEKLKLKWLYDLCEPQKPGMQFSRYGHQVKISEADFRAAQARLAAGAKDVLFEAERVDGHYALARLVGTLP